MYKLLVLDMDGTLLNEHQEITPTTIKAVKSAVAQGVKVVIATGRTKQGIDPYLKQLGLCNPSDYSIVCSGALVCTNTDQALATSPLSIDDLKMIYQIKETFNLDINVYTDNAILIEKENYYSEFDAVANNLPLEIADLCNLSEERPLLKAMLINEDLTMAKDFNKIFPSMDVRMPDIEAKANYNRRLFYTFDIIPDKLLERFNVSRVTPFNIEFSSKGANKRTGVQIIADRLGIKQDEIVCIGDSGNDRQMLKYAGLGIAMGNAFPEIKALADAVTASNTEDGVAKAIEKYILQTHE